MADTSPRLHLPHILPAQAQKHVTHNAALSRLEAIVQIAVPRFGETLPPADPAEGALHAIGAGAAGDWAGRDGMLALRSGGAWLYVAPAEGWRAWGAEEAELRVWADGGWQALRVATDDLPGLGVGTASDPLNRLAVAGGGSLFTHDGAGHRIAVNKAAAGDTAAVLFQTGWTGHAEIGLAGSDRFSVKTSADGSTWSEAIGADPASGEVALSSGGAARLTVGPAAVEIGLPVTGAAVQASATDATPGRLMLAEHGVLRSDIAGTVAESGGSPTGALFETGSTADGSYLRRADGVQICWTTADAGSTWTFPASFTGTAADRMVQATVLGNSPYVTSIGANVVNSCLPRAFDLTGTEVVKSLYLLAIGRWY